MRCPFCGADDTRVVDSRPSSAGSAIRRRRQCETCTNRFTTYERMDPSVIVVKRDGTQEPFSGAKIRTGLEQALADRPVAVAAVDRLVSDVEAEVTRGGSVVAAEDIGKAVLVRLRLLDEVAYLRFASVYKEFSGASDFEREMAALDDV
jgi:transcriptional repressor NrdR